MVVVVVVVAATAEEMVEEMVVMAVVQVVITAVQATPMAPAATAEGMDSAAITPAGQFAIMVQAATSTAVIVMKTVATAL